MAATTFKDVTIFSSAARTATANSDDNFSHGSRGLWVVLDITAASGTSPTLDVKLQRKDPLSGSYVDLPGGVCAQKTGTGTAWLTVYPGIAETTNGSTSDVISEVFRAVGTIGGTDTPTFTYSLAGSLIP